VTEAAIKASGIPYAFLRNGWYTENKTASIAPALERGANISAAADGRFSSATRQDFAEAVVAVLSADMPDAGVIYELAGDDSYSMEEFAAKIANDTGKPVANVDISEPEYTDALASAGLPGPISTLLTDSDAGSAKGALQDDSHALQRLIGRPTTPLVRDRVRRRASTRDCMTQVN